MASKKKPGEEFTGKSGRKVTYYLNGKLVERSIGVYTGPPTLKQLKGRQITTIMVDLFAPVKEFIRIGFEVEARRIQKLPYHVASSFNRINAVSGEYPNQYVRFENVLFSMGRMAIAQHVSAQVTSAGVRFNWEPLVTDPGQRPTDVVMLMAYEPVKQRAFFVISGPMRAAGTAVLKIKSIKTAMVLETYISFMSANRNMFSNSQYLGQLLWKI